MILVWIGLTGANYLSQYLHTADYDKTLTISLFQGWALFVYWLAMKVDSHINSKMRE